MTRSRVAVAIAVALSLLVVGAVAMVRTRPLSCDPAEDAQWDRYKGLRPGPNDHPNALWARHWWIGDEKSPCDYRKLARQIRQLGLTDVFFHAGPLRPDGTVNPDRYRHAKDLLAAMHDLVPGVRIQAYLGQFEGRRPGTDDLDLSDAGNMARVVDSAKIFVDFGYDGIHQVAGVGPVGWQGVEAPGAQGRSASPLLGFGMATAEDAAWRDASSS